MSGVVAPRSPELQARIWRTGISLGLLVVTLSVSSVGLILWRWWWR